MAKIQATTQLTLNHEPEDRLHLRVGSGDRLTLAESTPSGGIDLVDEPIGPLADEDPAATRGLAASHRPPASSAVLAFGVVAVDAVGNASTVFETFDRITDYPRGVATNAVAATESGNEALFSWTTSPDVEGA